MVIDQPHAAWHHRSMLWGTCTSGEIDTSAALDDALDRLVSKLDGAPDLVLVFASRHHVNRADIIPGRVSARFPNAILAGSSAWSVIGDGQEVEDAPSVAVMGAVLPNVTLQVLHVNSPHELEQDDDAVAMLVIMDQSSTDTAGLVRALDEKCPRAVKVGGYASGGLYPGQNVLFCGATAESHGAVIVSLGGDIAVDTIVAQGCRPIGPPLVVTRQRDNVILEFDRGKPADVLGEIYHSLSTEDRNLIPDSLHLGFQMHEFDEGRYSRGDYLVRPIRGIDPNSGALLLSEAVAGRRRARFHLRDATTSAEDLREWLQQFTVERDYRGALLFSCVSRGVELYGEPNHDTRMFREHVGDIPVAGFFGLGEIGPVGAETFLHAYTSMFAVFRPATDDGGENG